MNVVFKRSGGHNIVIRPMALPRGYAEATAPASTVDVWWRYRSEPVQACRFAGNFPVGQLGSIPFNPDRDENVIFHLVSKSADGVPSVIDLEDAVQVELIIKREIDAPVIGQNAPATTDTVEIGITNFTRFARQRRVTVSANADMSDPLPVLVFDSASYVVRELPRYLMLSREAGRLTTEAGSELLAEDGATLEAETSLSALPRTVYVTVAHSGGNGWTPESNVLAITFAAGDGTGGSAGEFDPTPRDLKNIDDPTL